MLIMRSGSQPWNRSRANRGILAEDMARAVLEEEAACQGPRKGQYGTKEGGEEGEYGTGTP